MVCVVRENNTLKALEQSLVITQNILLSLHPASCHCACPWMTGGPEEGIPVSSSSSLPTRARASLVSAHSLQRSCHLDPPWPTPKSCPGLSVAGQVQGQMNEAGLLFLVFLEAWAHSPLTAGTAGLLWVIMCPLEPQSVLLLCSGSQLPRTSADALPYQQAHPSLCNSWCSVAHTLR